MKKMNLNQNQMKINSDTSVRVLVVDDDDFMQDLLMRYLRRQNYDVITAGDAERAIAYSLTFKFDIAIVDILLGQIDGIELVDKLKSIQPNMIFIIMTGHPTLETALQAIEKGVNDYLIKPFKLEQLDDVIKKCLKGKESNQEIKRLNQELCAAQEKIQKYEAILSHGHRITPMGSHERIGKTSSTTDKDYRLYGYQKNQLALEKQLENLKILRDKNLIEDVEFEKREKSLKKRIEKGL